MVVCLLNLGGDPRLRWPWVSLLLRPLPGKSDSVALITAAAALATAAVALVAAALAALSQPAAASTIHQSKLEIQHPHYYWAGGRAHRLADARSIVANIDTPRSS